MSSGSRDVPEMETMREAQHIQSRIQDFTNSFNMNTNSNNSIVSLHIHIICYIII